MPEAAGKPNGSRPHGRVALVLAAVARWPWGKACELVTSVFSRQRQQFIHRYNSTVPIPGPNVPYLQRSTVPYPASRRHPPSPSGLSPTASRQERPSGIALLCSDTDVAHARQRKILLCGLDHFMDSVLFILVILWIIFILVPSRTSYNSNHALIPTRYIKVPGPGTAIR